MAAEMRTKLMVVNITEKCDLGSADAYSQMFGHKINTSCSAKLTCPAIGCMGSFI